MNDARGLVLQSVPLLASDLEDDGVVDAFLEDGVEGRTAIRLALFTPLAFGRSMLSRLGCSGLSPTAILKDGSGSLREVKLAGDPIFDAASVIAEQTFESGLLSRADFQSISLRSAEVLAANNGLRDGGDIRAARWSPPILYAFGREHLLL